LSSIYIDRKKFDIDLIVFDKDGLLFDSNYFWKELTIARLSELKKYLSIEKLLMWLTIMGISAIVKNSSEILIKHIDPLGITALATPDEESIITASFIYQNSDVEWLQARDIAFSAFLKADQRIFLEKCLHPKKGFPEIFSKLKKSGILYGIATSDNLDRAKKSINIFDSAKNLSFIITPKDVKNGKPDPEMLFLASKKMNIDTSKIMMVGDSYVDMIMARRAKTVGVGITKSSIMKNKMKPYAEVVVDSLSDIIIDM